MTTVDRPVRYVDVVRSEWTKFRSVRSTYWTYLIALLIGVGLGALVCVVSANHFFSDPTLYTRWEPATRSLATLQLGQLAFAVLGVMTVTSEYATGMIRTSLTAVPRRIRMMSAKLIVYAVASLVVGEVISFAAFLVGQALFHAQTGTMRVGPIMKFLVPGGVIHVPSATLGQHDVLRVVVGAGLYLTVIGLLGAGLGVIFRHAAAGIAVIVSILVIIPVLVEAALPTSWAQPIDKYWPTNAGQRVFYLHSAGPNLSAWWGFGDFALFTTLVIALSFAVLHGRDA
ncbi:MAG TPA: ABC transporter permease [Acidimicrobiales bacterium]|jgi:hypothetical protein|nr:ABC transporter permease [Acidimicrobiales bacterium]